MWIDFPLEHHWPEDLYFFFFPPPPPFFCLCFPTVGSHHLKTLKTSECPVHFPLLITHWSPVEYKMPASLRRTRRLFAIRHPTSPFFGPIGTGVFGFFALFRPSTLLSYTHCAHRSVIKKKKENPERTLLHQ